MTKLLLTTLSRPARPYLRAHGLLQVTKAFNRSALVWEPGSERVVVLAPHMDDEVIGCGGTLARHVACGAKVMVVFLTDGRRGGYVDPDEQAQGLSLTAVRKREAHAALAELGIGEPLFLDAEDGRLGAAMGLETRLRQLLLAAQPQVVYLPFLLEEHPDHRAVSALLARAVSGTPLAFRCHGYEVWTPLFPNCFVRIDATIDTKRKALLHYRSQLADADYLHAALGLNAYRSNALIDRSCRFAEAFCALPLSNYLELCEAYGTASG